ncbi:hypothetical protein [Candidatus Uabimicrobium amorphum]|uniref:Uncharacterized protein n=1 Tax=Uabimicrobium amorphum TaxID=2596890 RepID=A0A5S9F6G2_UABAM|nr:hypothetical protein [Candidatus Uabimicrobium amorphum]BBM86649.1 hypothetical protein UABAM_05035 [Candidatus Uabimicrobium amorphum]
MDLKLLNKKCPNCGSSAFRQENFFTTLFLFLPNVLFYNKKYECVGCKKIYNVSSSAIELVTPLCFGMVLYFLKDPSIIIIGISLLIITYMYIHFGIPASPTKGVLNYLVGWFILWTVVVIRLAHSNILKQFGLAQMDGVFFALGGTIALGLGYLTLYLEINLGQELDQRNEEGKFNIRE